MSTEPRPTAVRATISPAEWFEFRAWALGRGETAADALGDLIRRSLPSNAAGDPSPGPSVKVTPANVTRARPREAKT